MKKRVSSVPQLQGHLRYPSRRWMSRFGSVFVAVVVLLLLLRTFVHLRVQSLAVNNHVSDEYYVGKPKIAFLFLARGGLPLDFLWRQFFMGAEEPNFSIYIHARPGFKFTEKTTKCTFCYGRELTDSIQVGWGEATMIQAERLLFKKALEDPGNQRFILVSDSCVPLYNFSYTYNYIMSSPRSFVDSFQDTKDSRYSPNMSSVIPKGKWRKGSQWVALVRKHADLVVQDSSVFSIFKRHCKRRPLLPPQLRKHPHPGIVQKEHNCIPDEHYVQTLLSMNGMHEELERRTLTYTSWKQSSSKIDTQGWHPVTFNNADVDQSFLMKIKGTYHVNYATEDRVEWCGVDGKPAPCFLFARKFSRGAAAKLLHLVTFHNHSSQNPAAAADA